MVTTYTCLKLATMMAILSYANLIKQINRLASAQNFAMVLWYLDSY
ncbi:hypothetical protein AO376_0816 [Moraxella catarrhalis]|nr:hypothetical protein AO376_0816 [Moraxella catarrhalis]OAV17403.1 hypothetical protein AO374_1190 [Moraxella catarrhalis]